MEKQKPSPRDTSQKGGQQNQSGQQSKSGQTMPHDSRTMPPSKGGQSGNK